MVLALMLHEEELQAVAQQKEERERQMLEALNAEKNARNDEMMTFIKANTFKAQNFGRLSSKPFSLATLLHRHRRGKHERQAIQVAGYRG